MEVPAGQDGIQQLLLAEQEAQAIVAQARKAKAARLKQAKEEAEREVAAYKIEREADFKQKMAENSTSSQEHMARLNADSDRAVAAIKESIGSKKEQVIQMMLKQVQNVNVK